MIKWGWTRACLSLFFLCLFSIASGDSLTINISGIGALEAKTPCTVSDIQTVFPGLVVVRNRTQAYGPQEERPILIAKAAVPNPILQAVVVPKPKDVKKIDHVVVMTPDMPSVFGIKVGDTFAQARSFLAADKCRLSQEKNATLILCPARLTSQIWFGFGGTWPKDGDDRPLDFTVIPSHILQAWRVHQILWYPTPRD